MARYRPTFKVSPLKRPWYRRLTPLAWFTVGVGLVVVVLVVLAFCMACGSHPTTEPWSPTLNPTSAPTPTAEPSVPPTETAVLTPTPTHAPSVWWADQMIEDEQGHLQPPPEVQDQVWEAFITGLGCGLIAEGEMPPDNVAVFREAMEHLADDPQVWTVACEGARNEDEIFDDLRALVAVEFGPRNPGLCDESPTRC
ncbi:MAG TPA: hypothetical protein ENK08_06710, partial [Chloroflexi bacterium]|nr:hypothetical protein [Chloroflexota bacterium]